MKICRIWRSNCMQRKKNPLIYIQIIKTMALILSQTRINKNIISSCNDVYCSFSITLFIVTSSPVTQRPL